MSNAIAYQRGDVVLITFPFITDFAQTKLRPALVIQNNVGNQHSPNLIVAAITSQIPGKNYPTSHIIRQGTPAAKAAGLDRDSAIMGQVILTLPKVSVVRKLGHCDVKTMMAVDACLRVSLALQCGEE